MSCNTLQDALSSELILHAEDISTVKQLLLNGADINYQSNEGWCLLFELIVLGLDQHIVALKEDSFDIHIKDAKSRSALFWAINYEKTNIVKTLLTLGYDVNQHVTDELPALHYAVYKNNGTIVTTLLEHQIDIECKDKYENSALNYAYLYQREEMIKLLKQRGASSANLDY